MTDTLNVIGGEEHMSDKIFNRNPCLITMQKLKVINISVPFCHVGVAQDVQACNCYPIAIYGV